MELDRYIPFRIGGGSVAREIDEEDFAAFRQLPGEGMEVAGGHPDAVHENEGPGGGYGYGAGEAFDGHGETMAFRPAGIVSDTALVPHPFANAEIIRGHAVDSTRAG